VALRDPEAQVRANIAYALARPEVLPLASVPFLPECTSDPTDGLRLNAAVALRHAPLEVVADVMCHLLDDPNVRIRLVAAGAVLDNNQADLKAGAVVLAATKDPSPRVRLAADELISMLPARSSGRPMDLESFGSGSAEVAPYTVPHVSKLPVVST
jgi:HEAT repeat protein